MYCYLHDSPKKKIIKHFVHLHWLSSGHFLFSDDLFHTVKILYIYHCGQLYTIKLTQSVYF